jgi:hypothetical protein
MLAGSRVFDYLLLFAGLTLLIWATVLSRAPPTDEGASVVAMRLQHLTEGRSARR